MLSRRGFLSSAGMGTALAGGLAHASPSEAAHAEPPTPAATREASAAEAVESAQDVLPTYLDTLQLVERLHRRLLDVVKDEFERRGQTEVNSVQALLLYNIGAKKMTASQLRTSGYYLGSNVTYNIKKLVEMGYLHHSRARAYRRAVRIGLTETGHAVREVVAALYEKHAQTISPIGGVGKEDFASLNQSLIRLERFWTDQILYRI